MPQEWIDPGEVFGDRPQFNINAEEFEIPTQGGTETSEKPIVPPREDTPIKAKRGYKVGEVDLDEYPTTEIPEPGIGRPLERGEMNTMDRAGNDKEKIARLRKNLLN